MKTNGNGTRHPDQILAEIEDTRRQMDRTLGAIEQRLTPGQLLDQGMDYLKNSGAGDYVRNLRGSVSSNPLPVALVGIGLAWLAAADRMGRSGSGAERHSSLGEKTSAKASMQEALQGGRQKMQDAGRMARDNLDRMRGSYDRVVDEQPLALGAIGLAIGAVLAASLPRTRMEEQAMGGVREDLTDKAADLADEARQAMAKNINGGPQPPVTPATAAPGR